MKIVGFFKEVKTELTRVVWPPRKQAISHTIIVIAVTIIAMLVLAALDFVFSRGVEALIKL